jgi:hypothetical protein
MDHEEVGRYWDGNAEVWTELVRAGYDHYRDGLNTPAFFEMLPDVEVCPVSMSATTSGDGREINVWHFSAGPPKVREVLPPFRTPVFMRTLGSWLNRLVESGFVLERFGEPYPGDEAVRERPGLQDAQVVAYFLHVRARKPAITRG